MPYYERNLPHWHPDGEAVFLTWRLYGSLPQSFNSTLKKRQERPGVHFVATDRRLDAAKFGPHWLRDPRIAEAVVDAVLRGVELHHYELHAYVVMPNHVHVLVTPRKALAQITGGLKSASAKRANQILGRTGKRFWQDESFDHWIRTAAQLERVRLYIEHNPVSAGLAERPEDWPWSSADRR